MADEDPFDNKGINQAKKEMRARTASEAASAVMSNTRQTAPIEPPTSSNSDKLRENGVGAKLWIGQQSHYRNAVTSTSKEPDYDGDDYLDAYEFRCVDASSKRALPKSMDSNSAPVSPIKKRRKSAGPKRYTAYLKGRSRDSLVVPVGVINGKEPQTVIEIKDSDDEDIISQGEVISADMATDLKGSDIEVMPSPEEEYVPLRLSGIAPSKAVTSHGSEFDAKIKADAQNAKLRRVERLKSKNSAKSNANIDSDFEDTSALVKRTSAAAPQRGKRRLLEFQSQNELNERRIEFYPDFNAEDGLSMAIKDLAVGHYTFKDGQIKFTKKGLVIKSTTGQLIVGYSKEVIGIECPCDYQLPALMVQELRIQIECRDFVWSPDYQGRDRFMRDICIKGTFEATRRDVLSLMNQVSYFTDVTPNTNTKLKTTTKTYAGSGKSVATSILTQSRLAPGSRQTRNSRETGQMTSRDTFTSNRSQKSRSVFNNQDDPIILDDSSPAKAAPTIQIRKSTRASKNDRETLMAYFPPTGHGRVAITKYDYHRLDEGEFLNDVIIEFYIRYIVHQLESEALRERIWVFNSYFYKRYTEAESNRTVSYDVIKKWSSKVDLFEKDFIVVPINEAAHWYLAIICYPKRLLQDDGIIEIDEDDDSKLSTLSAAKGKHGCPSEYDMAKKCFILMFDSLRGDRQKAYKRLKLFLQSEAKERKCLDVDVKKIRAMGVLVPQQPNHCDCGVYLLHYVDKFFERPDEAFRKLVCRELDTWFTYSEIREKRTMIKSVIDTLAHEQVSALDERNQSKRDESVETSTAAADDDKEDWIEITADNTHSLSPASPSPKLTRRSGQPNSSIIMSSPPIGPKDKHRMEEDGLVESQIQTRSQLQSPMGVKTLRRLAKAQDVVPVIPVVELRKKSSSPELSGSDRAKSIEH